VKYVQGVKGLWSLARWHAFDTLIVLLAVEAMFEVAFRRGLPDAPLLGGVRLGAEQRHPREPVMAGSPADPYLTWRRPGRELSLGRSLARHRHPQHLSPSRIPDIGHDRLYDPPRRGWIVSHSGGDHGVRAQFGKDNPLNGNAQNSIPQVSRHADPSPSGMVTPGAAPSGDCSRALLRSLAVLLTLGQHSATKCVYRWSHVRSAIHGPGRT